MAFAGSKHFALPQVSFVRLWPKILPAPRRNIEILGPSNSSQKGLISAIKMLIDSVFLVLQTSKSLLAQLYNHESSAFQQYSICTKLLWDT